MHEAIRRALQTGELIDITTIGRRSRKRRRTEVVFHNIDGRTFISGHPGTRDWLANLKANPRFTFHLKNSIRADLPAAARLVTDAAERRAVLTRVAEEWDGMDVDEMVKASPLIEVSFSDVAAVQRGPA